MQHPKSFDTTLETSERMSHVKLKHGDAETLLAKALWHKGYRYRLNDKRLPGSPDIAVLKHKIAIFVDGEFWHGKDWANKKPKLKRNRDYWVTKIEENMARDKQSDYSLIEMGWTPIHFWSKYVLQNVDECLNIIEAVNSEHSRIV